MCPGSRYQEKSTGSYMSQQHDAYFVPKNSFWPFVAAVVMFTFMFGAGHWLNAEPGHSGFGRIIFTSASLACSACFSAGSVR